MKPQLNKAACIVRFQHENRGQLCYYLFFISILWYQKAQIKINIYCAKLNTEMKSYIFSPTKLVKKLVAYIK